MFDAHAHVDDCHALQIPQAIRQLQLCVDHGRELAPLLEQAEPRLRFNQAVHPWKLPSLQEHELQEFLLRLELHLQHYPALGVGEYGLDRQYQHPLQQQCFESHWQLARKWQRRQSLHLCGLQHLYLQLLKSLHYREQCVLLHGFNASEQMLVQLLRYPHYYGFGPRQLVSAKLPRLLAAIPLQALLFESDYHYDSPSARTQQLAGQHEHFCSMLGEIHRCSPQQAAEQLEQNYLRFA